MQARWLEITARLADPRLRTDAISALARELGAEALLIFVRDSDTGALLPAPGFPQTLPAGKAWRAFVEDAARRGEHKGVLRWRTGELRPAVAYDSGQDAVLVLVGDHLASDVAWLVTLIPLIAAALRSEQATAAAHAQSRMADETSKRSSALALTLDRARQELQNAFSQARERSILLERKTEQLEQMNALLREQSAELEAQAQGLESQAEELSRTNAALREAREAADRANRAKSDFLTTMSHELRTPLNAIAGYVQLLELGLHGAITDAQHEALQRIDRSQRHLLGLINDILNLSRIEAGRVDYDIRPLQVGEIVADLGTMIEPQLAMNGLTYEVRGGCAGFAVNADAEKVRQVLLNLLSNAGKFTPRGGAVTVECEARDSSVAIHVRDSGIGIPADKLDRIFDPFTQVDSSHSRIGHGAGLGLSISRDLAHGMGGDLVVASTYGQGSVFTLILPSADGAAEPAVAPGRDRIAVAPAQSPPS